MMNDTVESLSEHLSELKVDELRSRCRSKGISPIPKKKREQIQALINHEGSDAASETGSAALGIPYNLYYYGEKRLHDLEFAELKELCKERGLTVSHRNKQSAVDELLQWKQGEKATNAVDEVEPESDEEENPSRFQTIQDVPFKLNGLRYHHLQDFSTDFLKRLHRRRREQSIDKDLILPYDASTRHDYIESLLKWKKEVQSYPDDPSPSTSILSSELEIIGGKIGQGTFSSMFKGSWNGKEVAVKKLNPHAGSDPELMRLKQEQEATIQRKLRHRNVVCLYGCSVDPTDNAHCLLMEYMPKGSLRNVLDRKQISSWFTKERIAVGIAEGLAYLHSQDVAHRDLKSLNVVLNEEYHPKLCDFGISVTRQDASIGSTVGEEKGSYRWMAPETFETEAKEGWKLRKIDIYALGVILWELCTEEYPDVKGRRHRPDEFPDNGYPPHIVKLSQDCCCEQADERPSAAEVVRRLRQGPIDIQRRMFPEGIQTSHLMQGNIPNCRHVACLHSLKKNRFAPSIFSRLITERSRIDPGQAVSWDGWRVYFPYDNRPVDVRESDLEGKSIDGEEVKLLFPEKDADPFLVELLDAGQIGDKILLIAASRWRKLYGSTESVQPGYNTVVQGMFSRDSIEFLALCLYDRIFKEHDIAPHDPEQPLSSLNNNYLYTLLDKFAADRDLFLLTAGTTHGEERYSGRSASHCLVPGHMYSLLSANSDEQKVTLADPHSTEEEEFTITYEEFLETFRRLAGVQITKPSENDEDDIVEIAE